jgi:hypothetical protein
LLCHRLVIGLCVEKLWEAIMSLMDECSPHKIIKPDLAWFQTVRSPSIWGYFAPHLVCRIAGVVLPVEMCEESEVSELRAGVSNAASHRKGYVSSRISLMPGSDWAR